MPRTVSRVILALLAITSVQLGLWATFAPRSFYEDFPGGGRNWVAVDGPYNEHLVRDFGALNLEAAQKFGLDANWRRMSNPILENGSNTLDHHQNVDAAQGGVVDVGEVDREDRVGLRGEELSPGLAGPQRSGIDATALQDPPDGFAGAF